MAKQNSSYTKEDFAEFEKYLEKHPESQRWGMDFKGDTVWIPLHMIKEDHLVNIIKWIRDNPQHYTVKTLTMMEEQYQKVLILKTEAGQVLYGRKTLGST